MHEWLSHYLTFTECQSKASNCIRALKDVNLQDIISKFFMNETSWVILDHKSFNTKSWKSKYEVIYFKSFIYILEYRFTNIHMTELTFLKIIELWNVALNYYNNNNERFRSSRVITKTLLLDQSWTQSFLIRYKRWKQNIYDIQRRVKKQT